jgi:hypothetical protein
MSLPSSSTTADIRSVIVFNKVKSGLINIALTALNYSRICHIYNIYSSINRGVNKKDGAILRYFNVYNILIFVTWILLQPTARNIFWTN